MARRSAVSPIVRGGTRGPDDARDDAPRGVVSSAASPGTKTGMEQAETATATMAPASRANLPCGMEFPDLLG
jgi:hypothetical protein